MLISFEGLDASGKSTQINLLREALGRRNKTVLVLREPGGTAVGEMVRTVLLDKKHLRISPAAELFLFSASRAQLVAEVVKPALGAGSIVILDRYFDSTTAYQGAGRGIPLEAVTHINALATIGILPDLTFFIDIPVDEVDARLHRAQASRDRMESSGREFYNRVRDEYLRLAQTETRFRLIDGTQTVENIQRQIWQVVELHLGK
jgi:dTMP kinase